MDKNLLYKYFEGETTPEEIRRIRMWTKESDENKKEFYQERKLFDSIILLGSQNVSKKDKFIFRHENILHNIIKAAAVILATILVSLFIQHETKDDEIISMNSITVPAGQRVNLVLSDGTNLWLNSCSTLKYPSKFNRNSRDVVLDGEGYFEVAHDKKIPFIVHTNKCDVQVSGTKFDVNAYRNKDVFETSLMQGSVKVSLKNDGSHSLLLSPGTKAIFENGTLVSKQIDNYDVYRWKEGLICFKNLSFKQIMNEFEKVYDLKIIVNNAEALNFKCTGKFRQADGLDYALKVLQKEVNFKYYRDDNDVLYIN